MIEKRINISWDRIVNIFVEEQFAHSASTNWTINSWSVHLIEDNHYLANGRRPYFIIIFWKSTHIIEENIHIFLLQTSSAFVKKSAHMISIHAFVKCRVQKLLILLRIACTKSKCHTNTNLFPGILPPWGLWRISHVCPGGRESV